MDSLHVKGRHYPDPAESIKTHEGCNIPVGSIIESKRSDDDDNWWWRGDYSEYVVSREENIMLRYIVKFGDGKKKYSRGDFYMKDGSVDDDDDYDAEEEDKESSDQHDDSDSEMSYD